MYYTLLFTCLNFCTYAQTFDWENATDNGDEIVQTVDGVSISFRTSDNNPSLSNTGGWAGSSGNIVFTNGLNSSSSATITFDTPVNVASVYALDADGIDGSTWTFSTTDNNNPDVDATIGPVVGKIVTLNWINVTSFTITSSQGNESFGLDDVILDATLNVDDLNSESISIFPNPATDFIRIDGISNETYTIYGNTGLKVCHGTLSDNNTIDLRQLNSGIYFLILDNKTSYKFIKK